MIRLCISFLCLLFLIPVPASSQPEISPKEILRETLREKTRITPERLRQIEQEKASPLSKISPRIVDEEEEVVSGDALVESEVHAAMNPTDSANIVVSPIQQKPSALEGITCPVYYTTDFGKTWKKGNLNTLPRETYTLLDGGGDPVFAFDADGKLYHSWINYYSLNSSHSKKKFVLHWAYSMDKGATWTRATNDIIGAASSNTGEPDEAFDKQWLAVDRSHSPYRNTLYAAIFNPSSTDQKIIVRRKPPESDAFIQESVRVSDASFIYVQYSSIDVDDKGYVHVTFMGRKTNTDFALWHALSTDGGRSFQKPVRISYLHMPRFSSDEFQDSIPGVEASRQYPSPILTIDKSSSPLRGTLYMVWAADGFKNNRGNGMDIFFSRSSDNGASWSSPIIVNDDTRGIVAHQFHPSLAINPDGIVVVTWYDGRMSPNGYRINYFMAYSFNGGLSFGKNIQVSKAFSDFSKIGRRNDNFGIGEYTQVIATSGYALPVWSDGRSNDGDIDIYMAKVTYNGTIEQIAGVSDRYVLLDPRPNPADISSTVGFKLAEPSHIRFGLYDVAGKLLVSYADAHFDPGIYTFPVRGDDLASGIYYVQLVTDFGYASKIVEINR